MSLFDNALGQLGTVLGGLSGQQSALVAGALEMLGTGESGGLAGLVQAFRSKGLGDVVASWVGTGANAPVSAAQVQEALGASRVQQLAQRVGLPADAVSSNLADLLPATVDKLTPDGRLPESGTVEQVLALLKGRLG